MSEEVYKQLLGSTQLHAEVGTLHIGTLFCSDITYLYGSAKYPPPGGANEQQPSARQYETLGPH